LCGCTNNVIKYEHLLYNEDVSPYVIIQARVKNILNYEDKKETVTLFDIYLDVDAKAKENLDFNLKVIDPTRQVTTFKKNTKIPNRIHLYNELSISGNNVEKIILECLDVTFYDEVLRITDSDVKISDYKNGFHSNDLVFTFNVIEDSEKYNLDFTFLANNQYHLDIQMYLVDKYFGVYYFLGIYNYFRNSFPLTVKNNYIYKDIDIKELFIRVKYYDLDTSNANIILARFTLDEIKNKILD